MKRIWPDIGAVIVITLAVSFFFLRLFYPVPQLIVTPDYGRSDAWNFSFATKYFLSQNLHQYQLPLWSGTIGNGFPLYAEGQTGTFFLPNLIFFSLVDPVTAYNLALLTSVLTGALGLYIWMRILEKSSWVSVLFAVTFGLSGLIMPQLHHITLLQSFTLMPFIMAVTHIMAIRPSWGVGVFLSALIGQQILAGFPQGVFITVCFGSSYFIFLIRKQRCRIQQLAAYSAAFFFALLLGAVQLIPSYEFLKQIIDPSGYSQFFASQYSFPFRHLLTFIHPFLLGNPKTATYLPTLAQEGSIFWENSGYVGILPLLFVPFAFLKKNNNKSVVIFFTLFAIAALLLMLGRHSPFYVVFSLWPFNLFRVPSRFIWIFVLSLLMLSARGLMRLLAFIRPPILQRAVILFLIVFQAITLSRMWQDYHALAPAASLINRPLPLPHISADTKTYGIGLTEAYARHFLQNGWTDMSGYDALQTTLLPNANLMTGVRSHDLYAGRFLRRPALYDSLLNEEILNGEHTATVSALAKKLLDIAGVSTIVSATPLIGEALTLTQTVSQPPFTVSIYENPDAIPRAYLASTIALSTTKESAKKQFLADSFIPGKSVLLEQDIEIEPAAGNGNATITTDEDTVVVVRVSDHPQENILVLTDTYYPGWQAVIDGKKTPIYPANIFGRAVVVSAGDHTVQFFYRPTSLAIGRWISATAWLLVIVQAAFPPLFANARSVQEAPGRAPHPRRNPDT